MHKVFGFLYSNGCFWEVSWFKCKRFWLCGPKAAAFKSNLVQWTMAAMEWDVLWIAKTIIFSRKKSPPKLNIYGDFSLKQHNTVEYLGCCLDYNCNGSPWLIPILMGHKVLSLTENWITYRSKAAIWIISLEDCCVILFYNNFLSMDTYHGVISWINP